MTDGLVPEENKKAHKDDPDYLKAYEEDFKHRDKDNDGKMNMASTHKPCMKQN